VLCATAVGDEFAGLCSCFFCAYLLVTICFLGGSIGGLEEDTGQAGIYMCAIAYVSTATPLPVSPCAQP
jgi:hypothetical protein